MEDLQAWQQLHDEAEPLDPGALRALLRQVAALPMEHRWPWLAGVARHSRHTAAPVRVAVLDCLRGAGGYPAEQVVVQGLSDGAPEVRLAAVAALVGLKPGAWMLGCCHPDPQVRRATLERLPPEEQGRFMVLLADPECRELAQERLQSEGLQAANLGRLLAHARAGHVGDGWACGLLRALPWEEGWAALLESLPGSRPSTDAPWTALDDRLLAPDGLDEVLGWLARQPEVRGETLGRMLLPLLQGKVPAPLAMRVATSAAAALHLDPAGATPELLALGLWCWPQLLREPPLPDAVGRQALELLAQGAGAGPRGTEVEAAVHLLLDGRGAVSLAAVLGMLALHGPTRGAAALEALPAEALARALAADPERGARLVLDHGDEDKAVRRGLLGLCCTRLGVEAAPLLVACLRRAPEPAVEAMGSRRAAAVVAAAVARLDALLVPESEETETLARLLVDGHGRPASVLAERLARPEAPGPLTRAMLTRCLQLRAMSEVVAALGTPGLERLVALDEEHPIVHSLVLLQFLDAVRDCPSPRVQAWASGLRPPPPRPARRAPGRRGPLSRKAALLVRSWPEERLDEAIAPALAAPVQGLVTALASRPPPRRAHAAVCAALLLCDDPIDEVAWHLACYGLDDPEVAAEVDRLLVPEFSATGRMGPGLAAWLSRWDAPMATFARWAESRPGGIAGLLASTLGWQCGALRGAVWQGVQRLLGSWRWRAPGRLAAVVDAGLAPVLVAALDDRGAPGRGLLGFPASRADRDRVARAAAHLLLTLRAAGVDLEPWRARCTAALLDLEPAARLPLETWLHPRPRRRAGPPAPPEWTPAAVEPPAEPETAAVSVESPPAAPAPSPVLRLPARVHDLPTLVEACSEPAELVPLLRMHPVGVAELAALCLLDLGEAGHAALVDAVCADPGPHRLVLAQALGHVPTGWVRAQALGRLASPLSPAARLVLALGLARGRSVRTACRAALEAATTPPGLELSHAEVEAVAAVVEEPDALVLGLLALPGEAGARWALPQLLPRASEPAVQEALLAFLHLEPPPDPALRAQAADALWRVGRRLGLHLRLADRVLRHRHDPKTAGAGDWAWHLDARQAVSVVESAMLAGEAWVPAELVLEGLRARVVHWDAREQGAMVLLRQARDAAVGKAALPLVWGGAERTEGARRVAQTFHWGRDQGRKLLGKTFAVRAIGGDALGWTRLDERVIQVNPLPILRGERDGEAIVRGLLVHELGHHLYNAGPDGRAVHQEAQALGLSRLLNLVQDEHLERNLRALDERYGDDLKRLGAWAFQHARRAEDADRLRARLGPSTVPVLTGCQLGAARAPGEISIGVGRLLAALEAHGSSFARFLRALRMGLGNRHEDPRVVEALALFGRDADGLDFRRLDNAGLLRVTRRLQEIFGAETSLLDSVDLHGTASPGEGDTLAEGAGVSDADIQREVRRIDGNPREQSPGRAQGRTGRGGVDTVNVGGEERFATIPRVEVLPHDPAQHQLLAQEVARPARELRRVLETLGLSHRVDRPRLQGQRLDRGRLTALATRGDPRVMAARRRVVAADLFVGVVVDCSGSMSGERMNRARRFATLLAEACRGLPGVDLRVIGFTDRVIWDAGDARRCAAHALQASGGNNDAAGLWHGAQLALQSKRSARLLVMVSDGLPTECTTAALRGLVRQLTRKRQIACAQVAVHPLHEKCFEDYIEVLDTDVAKATRDFGRVVARLVARTLRG